MFSWGALTVAAPHLVDVLRGAEVAAALERVLIPAELVQALHPRAGLGVGRVTQHLELYRIG